MTLLQFIWPCAIFLSLNIFRARFQPFDIDDCTYQRFLFIIKQLINVLQSKFTIFIVKILTLGQFPTRQLPTSNSLLPFFQSYICTIENRCIKFEEFEEAPNYENVT